MFRQILRANFQLVGRTGMRYFSSAAEEGSIDHIQSLVAGKKVVVFMKGTPESPRCGFSNAVVQVLKLHGVDKYDSYDVLSNEKIRQGLDNLILRFIQNVASTMSFSLLLCLSHLKLIN